MLDIGAAISIAPTIRYTSPMLALGLVARWIQLATAIFLVGGW